MKKNAVKLFLILFLGCFKLLAQTNKLPVPTKSFIEKVKHYNYSDEKYFAKYLGIKSEHALEKFNDSKEVCSKEYEYKTGIKLKRSVCSESGSSVEIVFSKYPKTEVIKFVDWFFKTEYNTWNKAKTRYQPKEDGEPGCYLEIEESKNKIVLSYYCGC